MSQARQSYLGDIVAAFILLSRLPCGWYKFNDESPPRFETAVWAFPLVGLVIGAGGAAALVVLKTAGVSPFGAATIGIIVMTVLSGAMHDDGLADMADGFGGGNTVDEKIRIMHDSRIGSYGVLALCFSTVLRVSLLSSLCTLPLRSDVFIMLIAFFVAASRWQILGLLRYYKVSDKAELGKLTQRPSLGQIIIATGIWLVPVSILFGPVTGIVLAVSALVSGLYVGRLAMSQIGGLNGDIMGASIIVSEISMMLALVLLALFLPNAPGLA